MASYGEARNSRTWLGLTYMRERQRWYKEPETLLTAFTLGSLLLKDEVPVPDFHLGKVGLHQNLILLVANPIICL